MGVRLSDILLKIGLVAAILISLILSVLIWTNNARYERNPNPKVTSNQSSNTDDYQLSDVYLPARILQKSEDQQYMIYNRRENPNLSYQKQIKKWTVSAIQKPKSHTPEAYLSFINANDQIQLVYPDQVTWRLFQEIYALKAAKNHQDFSFNRLILKAGNTKNIYLADDTTHSIRTIKVKDNQVERLQGLLKNADLRLAVKEVNFNDHLTLFYTKTVEMTPYSYLISKENINTYIASLLTANDTDANIEARESGDVTTYYKGLYKKLSLNETTGQIQFEDYTDTTTIDSSTQLLKRSFNRLVSLGTSLTNVHYFSSDYKTQNVTYASYVEGFPVFQDDSQTSIQLTPSGQILRFSSGTLQVPIPAENQDSTLPTTEEMLAQLKARGVDVTAIKGIQLGYRWTQAKSSQQVIDLKPTYYVYLNDRWQDYNDLPATTQQGGGE